MKAQKKKKPNKIKMEGETAMKLLSINEIYVGLEQNLAEIEPKMKELQKKIAEYRKKMEEAENELTALSNQFESLRMSKESLELIDVSKKEATDKAASEEKEPEKKSIKKLKWTTKNARLLKLDRYDNILGDYSTQRAAARDMGWDESSMSRFLKFNKDQQIAKKNFYFRYKY